MTCPHCGAKTRSRTTVCPTCGHRPRRLKWLMLPLAVACLAFIAFITTAYLTDMKRSSDSLADKVNLNLTDDTAAADETTTVDLETLQDRLYTIGTGTGFLISPQDILTAAPNVADVTRVTMKQGDETVNGIVVGRTNDIAVIRIEQVKTTPLTFSHAIVGPNESVWTLAPDAQFEGTLTFEEDHYRRNFELPNRAIGSPIVTANGRVLGLHLMTKTLPVALFEQDVLSFLESDTPVPPPMVKRNTPAAELAPVAPITPVPKQDESIEPATELPPAPEATPEAPPDIEEPIEEAAPVEDETPAEPEQPAEAPETPPVTEQPSEPDVPITEPEEPAEPITPEPPPSEENEEPAPLETQDEKETPTEPEQPVDEQATTPSE